MKKIDWVEVSMNIIAYAGDAKSASLQALQLAKANNFEKAEELLRESDKSFALAGHAHLEIISREAGGENFQFPLLFIHAEDQLMNTETMIILVREIIMLYKK